MDSLFVEASELLGDLEGDLEDTQALVFLAADAGLWSIALLVALLGCLPRVLGIASSMLRSLLLSVCTLILSTQLSVQALMRA
mmetsp:Transcript_51776/g.134391  ORF Transcript_51776/g.134391 Transcript_51776/m.134391 type:complete len:83 (+) Transcript_51776:877-1125(+)